MSLSATESRSLARDVRRSFSALIATGLGTLGGILVDSGFEVRDAVLRPVYWLLGPVFDLFSRFPNFQLVIAGVVDRLPVVIIVGLALGLALRHLRYPRMLLCATVIWPVCVVVQRLFGMATGTLEPGAANSFLPEAIVYLLQYPIFVLVIRGADRLAAPRGTARDRGSRT
jgi:hypothetical protein